MESKSLYKVEVISSSKPFSFPQDNYKKVKSFIIVDDNELYAGQRITIMAEVRTISVKKQKEFFQNIAIASFIVGKDFQEEVDLLFGPADNTTIKVIGPDINIQMRYAELDNVY